ncbi:hypothetical protein BDQ17DRAFT_1175271, partial [Cyathus striatus]
GVDIQVTLRWVPGHFDIIGNNAADREAKCAITHSSSLQKEPPKLLHKNLPFSRSA